MIFAREVHASTAKTDDDVAAAAPKENTLLSLQHLNTSPQACYG
jgi:hypothetical protein